MKQRILSLLKYYVFWVAFFVVQKPLFMLWQYALLGDVGLADWFKVPLHGLPLDLSVAAYITAVYGLMLCVSVWTPTQWLRVARDVYSGIVLVVAVLVVIGDNGCFPSWGYHLDKDVFNYLATPKEVLACAPWWQWLLGFVCADMIIAIWWLVYLRVMRETAKRAIVPGKSRIGQCSVMVLLTALLFLPMRGSVTVSTMNTGRVYYSANRMLNIAAVNPVFNIVESLSENRLKSGKYNYGLTSEDLPMRAEGEELNVERLFTSRRPNIVLFILESFSKNALYAMPNMHRFTQEGVYFSNVYANSYRTDRGVMAVLGAYPGSATTSVMTVPSKSSRLPQIGPILKAEGYDLKFYYGGDEDFTNMRSYLMTGGFEQRVCDHDFPLSQRMSKWGVPDHVLFDYAAHDIPRRHQADGRRQFSVVLSLSSHEPFDVPYRHYEDPFVNAVGYTDSCLGAFVDSLRRSPMWDSTVVVMVADHGYPYPRGIRNYDTLRYAIPLVMVGGAVRAAREVPTLCSQIDWVPTMLHQMGLEAGQFVYAKDILDVRQTPYAYYHFVDGFALMTESGTTIIDAVTNETIYETNSDTLRARQARAITQKIYEDLD